MPLKPRLKLIPWLLAVLVLVVFGWVYILTNLPPDIEVTSSINTTDIPPGFQQAPTMTADSFSLEAEPSRLMVDRLRINLDAFPLVLDPQKALLPKEIALLSLAYQGLTRLNENLEAVPAAAESWRYNSNSTQLTFTLQRNLRYSDGSVLNALRFAMALQRASDPLTASGYAWLLDPIKGARDWRLADPSADDYQPQVYISHLGIQAMDSRGQTCTGYQQADCLLLRLDFNTPTPYFHFIAGLWLAYPVKEELVTAGGDSWWISAAYRAGNGPYILQDLEPFVRSRFVPNPYYEGKAPSLHEIEFFFIGDAQAALRAFVNDQLDIITTTQGMLPVIRSSESLSQMHLVYPGACNSVLRFNWLANGDAGAVDTALSGLTDASQAGEAQPQAITATQVTTSTLALTLLGELNLRQAFAWTYDAEGWSREIDGGLSIPSWTWIPQGFPGYDPTFQPYVFDPDKARQALSESSIAGPEGLNGLAFRLAFLDTPTNRLRYTWLAQNYLKNLGIEFMLDPMNEAAYSLFEQESSLPELFTRQTWCAPYPDPHAWLSAYWLAEYLPAGGAAALPPDFAALVEAADAAPDAAERLALYQQAQHLLLAYVPGALGQVSTNHFLVKPWVRGIIPSPYDTVWPGSQFVEEIFLAR